VIGVTDKAITERVLDWDAKGNLEVRPRHLSLAVCSTKESQEVLWDSNPPKDYFHTAMLWVVTAKLGATSVLSHLTANCGLLAARL
jgi:hypothetical protein